VKTVEFHDDKTARRVAVLDPEILKITRPARRPGAQEGDRYAVYDVVLRLIAASKQRPGVLVRVTPASPAWLSGRLIGYQQIHETASVRFSVSVGGLLYEVAQDRIRFEF
jgi:hypothetical protein